MKRDEMIAFLRHPGLNKSWFARQVFKGYKGAEKRFHAKLYGHGKQHFTFEEIMRVRDVIIEFANYDLNIYNYE